MGIAICHHLCQLLETENQRETNLGGTQEEQAKKATRVNGTDVSQYILLLNPNISKPYLRLNYSQNNHQDTYEL